MRTMLSMWAMTVLGALGTHVTGARAGLLATDGTDNRCTEHRSLAWCVLSLAKGAEKLRDTNQELIEQAIQAAHKKNGSAAMSEVDRVDLAFSSLEIGLGLLSNSASGLRGGVIDLLALGLQPGDMLSGRAFVFAWQPYPGALPEREAKEALVNDILQAVQTAIPGCKLERRSTTPLHATFTEGYKRTYTFDKAGASLILVGSGDGCHGHEYRITFRPEWYSGPVLSHAQARIIDHIPAYLGTGSKFVALNDVFHAIDIPDVTVDGKPDYVLLPAHLVDALPSWAYIVVGPQRKDAPSGQMLNKGFLLPVMYRGGSHAPHFTIFPEYSDADAVLKLGNPLFPHEPVNVSGEERGAR